MRALRIIALLLAGLGIYALVNTLLRQRRRLDVPAGQRLGHVAVEPLGNVPGAAIVGGGEGVAMETQGPGGSSVRERVGRGVVRRKR